MNFHSIVVLIFFMVISSTNASIPESFIHGGDPAKEGQFPHQVSVQYYGDHYCGGSILNQRWVITARHCIIVYQFFTASILFGTIDRENGIKYGVEEVIIRGNDYDLALIKVDKDFEFNDLVKPIELYEDELEAMKPVIASGWGHTEKTNKEQFLMYTNLTTISNDDCAAAYNRTKVEPYHLCTKSPKGIGTCLGDSGGPLMYEGKLVGLVSFGIPCARGYPDVFVRISYHIDWIKKYIDM